MTCFDEYRRQMSCAALSFTDSWLFWGLVIVGAGVLLIALCMAVFPVYGVWAARKSGEAAFAEAQNEQRVILSEANARLEAAETNKKAAIIEAEAVAQQINTIGTTLTQHDLYLRWQWIEMMKHRKGTTIYVPTEANLPILEATRKA